MKKNNKSNISLQERYQISDDSGVDDSKKNIKKSDNFFFFKLSIIGRFMLIMYLLGAVLLGALVIQAYSLRGEPILENRQEPENLITDEQLQTLNNRLEEDLKDKVESINAELKAFRLIVIADLKDDLKVADAKAINKEISKLIDEIMPFADHFTTDSDDQPLNYDFVIYTTDVIPKDSETASTYIYTTYKNSRMTKTKSYDYMKARDEDSYKQAMDLLDKIETEE